MREEGAMNATGVTGALGVTASSEAMDANAPLSLTPLETVRYDVQTGLVPVVVQDAETGLVLTLAYANREALKRTLGTGQAWFWSRSRQEYWRKGATSGNVQQVVEMRVDCDGDAVLYRVLPSGPACHTGQISCFYRQLKHGSETGAQFDRQDSSVGTVLGSQTEGGQEVAPGADVADRAHGVSGATGPSTAETVSSAPAAGVADLSSSFAELWTVMEDRWQARSPGSYTTYLFEHGVDKVAKKVGEEAVEVVLAAKNAVTGGGNTAGRSELAFESADLLYHLLALWKTAGISPTDVARVLQDRARG